MLWIWKQTRQQDLLKDKTRTCLFLNIEYETNMARTRTCVIKEFTKFYCKKHERNKTNLWLKDVLKIGVEQTKGYESPISYLYLLGELVQSTFDLVQLLVDWKSIKIELGIN